MKVGCGISWADFQFLKRSFSSFMMNFHEFHYKMSEMLMKMSEMFNGVYPYFLVREWVFFLSLSGTSSVMKVSYRVNWAEFFFDPSIFYLFHAEIFINFITKWVNCWVNSAHYFLVVLLVLTKSFFSFLRVSWFRYKIANESQLLSLLNWILSCWLWSFSCF
jgi:hypothetical protein